MKPAEQKIYDDVEKFGWHVINVFEDDDYPEFSYSIGFFHFFNHPEVIIIGLRHELVHVLINNMGEDVRKSTSYSREGFYSNILDDFDCWIGTVPETHFPNHVGWASWFYKTNAFPLVQCVYPTVDGIFPWDPVFPENTRFYSRVICKGPDEQNIS